MTHKRHLFLMVLHSHLVSLTSEIMSDVRRYMFSFMGCQCTGNFPWPQYLTYQVYSCDSSFLSSRSASFWFRTSLNPWFGMCTIFKVNLCLPLYLPLTLYRCSIEDILVQKSHAGFLLEGRQGAPLPWTAFVSNKTLLTSNIFNNNKRRNNKNCNLLFKNTDLLFLPLKIFLTESHHVQKTTLDRFWNAGL